MLVVPALLLVPAFASAPVDELVFADPVAISPSAQLLSGTDVADVDGDGDLDILLASSVDRRVAWLENADGAGTFGALHAIEQGSALALEVFAADLDGDGDQDVIAAFSPGIELAWFENLGGGSSFGPKQVIGTPSSTLVVAEDIDGDGDRDLVQGGASPGWYENLDGAGTFGALSAIAPGFPDVLGLSAADLDLDGDVDVLAAGGDIGGPGEVAWFANDGAGGFGPAALIATTTKRASNATTADVDADGDIDALFLEVNDLHFLRNTGGGTFSASEPLAAGFEVGAFTPIDLDGDLDLDVVADLETFGSGDALVLVENLGAGGFGPGAPVLTSVQSDVAAMDADGDGAQDVLRISSSPAKLALHENQAGVLAVERLILLGHEGAARILARDLDGDARADLITRGTPLTSTGVAWHRWDAGVGSYLPMQDLEQADAISAGDVDGDGDLDLVSVGPADVLGWNENTDGLGTYGPRSEATVPAPDSVTTADLDGDGDLDYAVAGFSTDSVRWVENADGVGTPGAIHDVTLQADGAVFVTAADVDADGDIDLASASRLNGVFAWYRNEAGVGDFGAPQVLSAVAALPTTIQPFDLDGDGDQDFLASSAGDGVVAWFDNQDGLGGFGAPLVVSLGVDGVAWVDAGDVDGDGDLDVVSAAELSAEVAWYENVDGLGTFSTKRVMGNQEVLVQAVALADLDGDLDLDALAARQGNASVILAGTPAAYVRFENDPCTAVAPAAEIVRLGVPPNPFALLPGVSSAPILCETWDPIIDHTLFAPSAVADFLAIGGSASNIPTGFGTLLCTLPTPELTFQTAPNVPFAIPIPGSCLLVGAQICAQGASLDANLAFVLTNALDVTIGTF